MNGFFYFSQNGANDPNGENIISIDFSHFDSLSLTDIDSLFLGLENLQEINFNNFKTSNVTTMEYMFNKCKKLRSLDLSSFDISQVIKMEGMFDDCTSLEYLDISNFNTKLDEDNHFEIFKNVNNLKYINIYNSNLYKIKSLCDKVIKDFTIVCQKNNDYIIGNAYIEACCDFNNNIAKCHRNNYISIRYNKNFTYENGFYISSSQIPPEFRKGINYIKNEENIIAPSRKLEIKSGSKIEIHLDK